jgi:hypothetical protein
MKIVLNHEGTLNAQEECDLRYLLADALLDFIRVRREPLYVETHYMWQSKEFRDKKNIEVSRRMDLAHKLRSTALNLTLEENNGKQESVCIR